MRAYNDTESDVRWDGVWFAKTDITDFGWTIEYQIPFSTLDFKKNGDGTWGLNIFRFIPRKNEYSYWQKVTRDDGYRVSRNGHLENLVGIKPGLNLEILPYVTGRGQKDRISSFSTRNDNGIAGVNISYGISSNLTGSLTLNPDFAQIEADEDLINLTRYPLYLTEKRPFFTEGASVFNTAGNNSEKSLFYSRRMNEPEYGLKINGKTGDWDIGILHVLNDNDMGINEKIDAGDILESSKNKAFYNIVRFSRDIFTRSQLGFITMTKEYDKGYNRIIGFDGKFRFKDNFNLYFEGVKSFSNVSHSKSHSINSVFFRMTDFFSFASRYDEQGPNFFGNDIGFYDYNDVRSFEGWFQLSPRLENIGIRQLWNRVTYFFENYWANNFFDKQKLTRTLQNSFWIQFMNYLEIRTEIKKGKEYDRFDKILYPVDSYGIKILNNRFSPLYFTLEHTQGKYRTGYSWSYKNSIVFKPVNRINMEFSYNRSLAKLINRDTEHLDRFIYEVWRTKFHYYFNRNLNARIIFQYSGMEKRLDTYYLLAYNFRPKSFFYIAYTERFDEASYLNNSGKEIFPGFGSSYKILQIKWSYLFLM